MSQKIGMNVALGLDTQRFQAGLDKSRAKMKQFSDQAKKSGGLLKGAGLGGLGGGLGAIGNTLGVAGTGGGLGVAAKIALPLVAAAGVVKFIEGVNKFRVQAVKHMEEFNKGFSEGKVGKLVTDQFSGFALLAAQQKGIIESPAFLETLKQSVASGGGGQDLLSGARGLAGIIGETINMLAADPWQFIKSGGLLNSSNREQAFAAADVGMSQNTAQAQVSVAMLEELRRLNGYASGGV